MEVSHSYAHLEPNTPLSSSSTVLSLFCSSFSRSLASASSCQWKTDSYYIITVHTVAPHWLDLWISSSTWVGVSAGWGEGGDDRYRGVTCFAGGLPLVLPAICAERRSEYKWAAHLRELRRWLLAASWDTVSAKKQLAAGLSEGNVFFVHHYTS